MRMNKGGVTPCDRRLDRRKVAIAAAAAVLLFATSAQALVTELQVVTASSSLGFVERITSGSATFVFHRPGTGFVSGDPLLAPGLALGPAYSYLASSTTAWGVAYADVPTVAQIGDFVTPIQMLAGSRINYNNGTDNEGFGPGVYLPFRNSQNVLQVPPGGIPTQSQFGMVISERTAGPGFGFARIFDLYHDFGSVDLTGGAGLTNGGPALVSAGGTNYVAAPSGIYGQALMAQDGWEDVFGPVVDQIELETAGPSSSPFPSPFVGNTATWDGTFLTIPMNFHLNFVSDGLTYDIDTFGQLVLQSVPEPSTLLMTGFGVVGLLSYAWRTRKRRALVA